MSMPLISGTVSRISNQYQQIRLETHSLDLRMVERPGQADLRFFAQYHFQHPLRTQAAGTKIDHHVGEFSMKPAEHFGQEIGTDCQCSGDSQGAAALAGRKLL